jgi:adenylate cyclase
MVSLPLVDQVALALSQDQHNQRIKKLLICNCYGTWEGQPDRINEISWRQLLVDTLERSPTLDALNFQLNQLAKTLSKPVEYAQVANQIIEIVQELYRPRPLPVSLPTPLEDQTQWFAAPPSTADQTQLINSLPPPFLNPYDLVLQRLQTFPDEIRLKKLTYCLCYNQWPQDQSYLAAVTWPQLLQTLLELVSSPEHLRYLTQHIAQSISKPQEYLVLGNALCEIVSPLYQVQQTYPINQIHQPPSELPDQTILVATPTPLSTAISDSIPTFLATPVAPEPSVPPPPPQPEVFESCSLPTYDRYDIRVEIMKYTNPFMAKLLLYAVIYEPPDFKLGNWSGLNQTSLDELLEYAVDRYQTSQTLKTRLVETAKKLPHVDLARQAAATIFRVLKPYCQQEGSSTSSEVEEMVGKVPEGDSPTATQQLFPPSS